MKPLKVKSVWLELRWPLTKALSKVYTITEREGIELWKDNTHLQVGRGFCEQDHFEIIFTVATPIQEALTIVGDKINRLNKKDICVSSLTFWFKEEKGKVE